MPIVFSKWQWNVPDAGALAQRCRRKYNPVVPWRSIAAGRDFSDGMAPLYQDLWTNVLNDDVEGFCDRLAQFVNFQLLPNITETPPRAFELIEEIMFSAGFVASPTTLRNDVLAMFYQAAKPLQPGYRLAQVLRTAWV